METDREGLFEAASDPLIWEQHPSKERGVREHFDPYFDWHMEKGSTLVVRDRAKDKIIGCSRYYVAEDGPDDISIGFTFLTRAYWGGPTNLEMKTLMFDHAFQAFDAVWLHIDPDNIRSQKAAEKVGARYIHARTLTLGARPADYVSYRIDKADWFSLKQKL